MIYFACRFGAWLERLGGLIRVWGQDQNRRRSIRDMRKGRRNTLRGFGIDRWYENKWKLLRRIK